MPADLRTRSLKGILWSGGEGLGVALLSFGSFAVMATMLEPQDFGVVALAGVFVYFLGLLTGHSFSDAIVQREDLNKGHIDTAFWGTAAIAIAATSALALSAEVLAEALGEPRLTEVLGWLSLVMPLTAIASVPSALFRREMQFRVLAVCNVAGRAVGAVVGIAMAFSGFGLWSLVGQQLAAVLVTSVAVLIATDWRPGLRFRFAQFAEMGRFGFYVSMTQVASGAGEQLLNLLIGTLYGSTALGYFNVAWRMVQLIRSLMSSAVYHVGLSAFARLQSDRTALMRAFLQATRISCLVGFPIGVGIALLGPSLIQALFGAKWDASVPLLTILALEFLPAGYGMFLSALYRAVDRAGWGLGMALLYASVGVGGALIVADFGVLAVAAFWVARTFLLIPVHVLLVRRLSGLPVGRILNPIPVPLAATAIMALAIVALGAVPQIEAGGPALRLAILVPAGVVVYWAAIRLLSPDLFNTMIGTARVMVAPRRDVS